MPLLQKEMQLSVFVDPKTRFFLKIGTFVSSALCALIPYGYYSRCESESPFTILSVYSIYFYVLIFYLFSSLMVEYFNKGYLFLITDVIFAVFIVKHVVFIEILMPLVYGVLSEIFGNIGDSLTGRGPCNADVVFHYQWGYLFYVLAVSSFFLSTILGLIVFLSDRRHEKH